MKTPTDSTSQRNETQGLVIQSKSVESPRVGHSKFDKRSKSHSSFPSSSSLQLQLHLSLTVIMLQSLLVLCLANVMIIPIIFATPFQQFYKSSQTGDIRADQAPSFLEASYDGDQATLDSSTSKPAFLANNQFDWLKNFFVPSPPTWQGTDKNIAAQFTCEASTAYCCTGRYDAERKYALQPCYYCANHIPQSPSRPILKLWLR